jgi:zinc protease
MRHVLSNGLTVLLEESHAAPVAAIQAWVSVGSADETEDEAGLAHLHEHMLFKGTARRAPGEIARDVEARGGEINAWTSYDETVYHLVLASEFLGDGLDILSDALRASTFDAAELARETEVVVEEIKRSQDMPARKISRDLFALCYKAHPYRLPVIGTEESVRSFDRPKILGFYRRHYTPKSIVLAVVGDFEEKAALAEVERRWGGDFGTPGGSAPKRAPEPEQREARVHLAVDDVREAYLSLGWHVPGLKHQDIPALDLLAIVLGQGDSSRLSLNVKRRLQLATEAYAYCYTPRDPGLFVAGATVAKLQGAEALRAMLHEIQRMREEPIGEADLATAKRQIESEAIYQHETVQGWARKLGYYEASAGSLDFEAEYQAKIQATSAEQVRLVAERYLTPERISMVGLLPEGFPLEAAQAQALAAEGLRPVSVARAVAVVPAATSQTAAAPPVRSGRPEPLRTLPLPGGGTLLVQRDPSVPLAAFRAVYPGGLRWETEANNGIDHLLSTVVTRGAAGRTAEEISRAVDRMAGGLGAVTGRNSFGLRGEFLSRFFPDAFALFLDCLLKPDLAEAEIQKEREVVLQDIQSRDDHPAGVAFDLFARTLYRVHPYRLNAIGETASVEKLGRAELQAHLRKVCGPAALTLAVVGDVDPDRVLAMTSAALKGDLGETAAPPPPPAEPRPAEPRRADKVLEKAQAHFVLGYLGVRLTDADRFPLEVLSSVLSGQGGRLFVELRDKRSMAYSVTSMNVEGLDPGYFAVYMGTSPEKVCAAIEGVHQELDRVRQEPVGKEELARAQRYLVGSHAIGLQRRSAAAGAIAFDHAYGLGPEAHRQYAQHIEAVRAENILAVARKWLDPRGEVLAVVGPKTTIRS